MPHCKIAHCTLPASWLFTPSGRMRPFHACPLHADRLQADLQRRMILYRVTPLAKPETKENKDG